MTVADWNREVDQADASAGRTRHDVGRLLTLRTMISLGRTDLEDLYAQAVADASDGRSKVPAARHTDPDTSHAAARRVRAGNEPIVDAIRSVIAERGPSTAFEIADAIARVHGDRWDEGSVRSACARAGLKQVGESESPRGSRCAVWSMEEQ